MKHLERLMQLCFLWHVIKIIETRGEMLSNETIFQLQKHPAANRDDADVIKNISKIFNDYSHTPDENVSGTTYNSTYKNNSSPAELFEKFKQIERKEIVDESDRHVVQFVAKQPKEENHRSLYEVQPFNNLQQFRLDEQQQQQQQQNQQQLAQAQQQTVVELQHIMHKLDTETLGKATKKKKKKKRKKKRKKKKPAKQKKRKKNKQKPTKHQTSLISHPAHILFASPTQRPLHHNHQQHDHPVTTTTTTKHPFKPIKKIKYILRKNTIFKKKKKEYLNHLKHVLYPFVKFIAFFTVINPFTLVVFLFTLISPVVFGFLGFIGLSFLIKPALNLLFGIRNTVNTIKRRKLKELRRKQRLRDSRRPITIHKHYYQQLPIKPPSAAPHRLNPHPFAPKPKVPFHHSLRLGNRHHHTRKIKLFNPLLPDMKQILKKDKKYIFPDIKGYNDSFEEF